ncbi:MAG: T9SS type A sorting domain-containing protein [Ignavibacteria bacterium]|nr:T9SS type A sorting domain-containing protein [Ignavibacteria bacterium]
MKFKFIHIAAILILIPVILLTVNSVSTGQSNSKDIIVSFITYNGYGNNLYIDNLLVGQKPELDIAVVAVLNIGRDTTYVTDTSVSKISPQAMVFNAGNLPVSSSFLLVMQIDEFGYQEADTIAGLNSGFSMLIEFDSLTYSVNVPFTVKVYIAFADSTVDSNRSNDTLIQKGIFLEGVPKKILIEGFTNTNSPGCASQDPFINALVNNRLNDVCAVKYHTGFPLPANDSMYLFNSQGSDARTNYYSVNSVPNTYFNGNLRLPLPYTRDSVINANFEYARKFASPVLVTVRDSMIGNDSIKSNINVNLLYNLKSGEYRLRIMSVERLIIYDQPPGTNGQTQFFDVFRRAYPDSNGFEISPAAGNYEFTVTYPIEEPWADTMIYTVAFLQNDMTKEILNCGRGKDIIINIPEFVHKNNEIFKADLNYSFYGRNYFFIKSRTFNTYTFKDSLYSGNTFYELFEYEFPPQGWILNNADRDISIQQVTGTNGRSFGGFKCLKMPFFDYSNIGQYDTLITKLIPDITENDTLQFDYAYARYIGDFIDSLRVEVSTDGGTTYTEIFNKGGNVLATSSSTTLPFSPSTASQWMTFYYPMSLLLGGDNFYAGKSSFELMQNYPNPFNPKTIISYRVLKDSYITMKVYDITGRELITLVSNYKRKGDYFIEFDNSLLSSGVYFYRMISGDYSDTKKMVLVK